jgi:hypothetical protein
MTIVLKPAVRSLPAMITTDSMPHYRSSNLREFEERRRTNVGGYFLSEAELRKHDTQTMTPVIRTFPGLLLRCSRTGAQRCIAASVRQNCPVVVYPDGVRSTDNDLEKLSVNEFAGVEYYPGGASMPAKYNATGSACGVMLFWTRER